MLLREVITLLPIVWPGSSYMFTKAEGCIFYPHVGPNDAVYQGEAQVLQNRADCNAITIEQIQFCCKAALQAYRNLGYKDFPETPNPAKRATMLEASFRPPKAQE